MADSRISRILLSEWIGLLLAVLMIVCITNGVHDNRPPTWIERAVAYGSIGIVSGWFLIKGWSMCCVRGATPR
jgi:hypothetical protein